jgi:ubiquinone/menaquinone biosynthesis C-methylase UbiE
MLPLRRLLSKLKWEGRSAYYRMKYKHLEPTLAAEPAAAVTPQTLFGGLSDEFWFWLNTEGYRQSPKLQGLLPGLPSVQVQTRFTGAAGDQTLREGFLVYSTVKRLFQEQLGNITDQHKILDFGCGWGRVTRFFLKDIYPSNLWGIDCVAEGIQLCKQTNRWSNFDLVGTQPPTRFPNDTFDLIYCYSVFSHLSEDIHEQWLAEFQRILRPNGLLMATTRSRDFIIRCAQLRSRPNLPEYLVGASKSFPNMEQSLVDYDRGLFCHSPTGGGGILETSFYGETCIPKAYILSHWAKLFLVVSFIEHNKWLPQNIIVVQKRE